MRMSRKYYLLNKNENAPMTHVFMRMSSRADGFHLPGTHKTVIKVKETEDALPERLGVGVSVSPGIIEATPVSGLVGEQSILMAFTFLVLTNTMIKVKETEDALPERVLVGVSVSTGIIEAEPVGELFGEQSIPVAFTFLALTNTMIKMVETEDALPERVGISVSPGIIEAAPVGGLVGEHSIPMAFTFLALTNTMMKMVEMKDTLPERVGVSE
jgi:hypothetical protein